MITHRIFNIQQQLMIFFSADLVPFRLPSFLRFAYRRFTFIEEDPRIMVLVAPGVGAGMDSFPLEHF